jgi:RimJ/RimL family protein N-acetyltransferase
MDDQVSVDAVVIETDRLTLRRFVVDDAPFALTLVNDPFFKQFIGDKGVRTEDDARAYLQSGPLASYAQFGFGLFLVARKADGAEIGMCGLLKRPTLEDVDLGYAFLPTFWHQGYAREAAAATLTYGTRVFGLTRVVAITTPENAASIRVLLDLGFVLQGLAQIGDKTEALHLYSWQASPFPPSG